MSARAYADAATIPLEPWPAPSIAVQPVEQTQAPPRMARKFLSGWVSTAVSGAVMFVSYRMYLNLLGYEQYGLWLLLATVLNVVQLGSVGLGPALTRLAAQRHASAQLADVHRPLLMSVALVSAMGLALTIAILGARGALLSALHVPAGLTKPFLALLPLMTLLSVYAVVVDLFLATLSGLGRIDAGNYAQMLSQVIGTIVSILLLRAHFGLFGLASGTAVSLILLHALVTVHISRIAPIRLKTAFAWDYRELRALLGFGGWVAGSTIMNAAVGPVTRLLLARYNGLAAIPTYDLAFGACYKLRGVWECAMRALLPEVSRLAASHDPNHTAQIPTLYKRANRLLLAGATPMYAVVFLLAAPLLTIWLGRQGAAATPTLRILLAATFVNLLAVPPYYLLMGIGRVRHCFAASAAMAAVSIACAAVAIRYTGTLPVTIASASFLLGASVLTLYLTWQAKRPLAQLDLRCAN